MLAKLIVLILSLSAISASALAYRHARLQAARELAEARLRVRELDERLARVRSRIAERVDPARVDRLAERLGETKPILRPRRDDPLAPDPFRSQGGTRAPNDSSPPIDPT